ncbi:MAG: site-2 protease family protein, partial [Candidatus Omnitrophota bacterium]|nr:site-2 protease family protein [Candidatus Omnitrophota bacterium]
MIATIIFVLILSLLIIVHEFGHFIAARRNGVRVEQFSLGFGRQILKKKK